MSAPLSVGDKVKRAGHGDVAFMVLQILPEDQVRIRRWPITAAPPAEDVDAAQLTPAPRAGLDGKKKSHGGSNE